MYKSFIDPEGKLFLGERAQEFGFRPGMLIQVLHLSSGAVLLRVDDDPLLIDLPALKPLPRTYTRGLPAPKEALDATESTL